MRLFSISADEWDRAWGTLMLGVFVLVTSVATWKVAGEREAAASLLGIGAGAGVALGVVLLVRGVVAVVRIQGAGVAPLLQRPTHDAPCPRCAVYVRGDSGWCESCWSTLRHGWLPSSHPARQLTEALSRHDTHAALGWLDDCYLDHQWCKRSPSRDLFIQETFLRRLFTLFPEYAASVEIAVPDPGHPSVVWLRILGTGRLRLLGTPLQSRQVFRCQLEGDRIVESWSFRPII